MVKTILFAPLNTPGHINSSVALADVLKAEYNYRVVFLLLGKSFGSTVEDHDHELVQLNEEKPYEDYEISDDEDLDSPVDEASKEAKGRKKRPFSGCEKWPQLLMRCNRFMKLEPIQSFIKSIPLLEGEMVGDLTSNHEQYVRALAQIKPDLVIVDGYFLPPSVLDLNKPWGRLHSANPLPFTISKLPNGVKPTSSCGYSLMTKDQRAKMQQEEPEKWQRLVEEWRVNTGLMENSLEMASRPLRNYFNGKNPDDYAVSPFINLYLYPEFLDYDKEDDILEYPPRFFRCNSLLRKDSCNETHENRIWAEKLASKSAGKSKVIFFSLGTIASGNTRLMKRFMGMLEEDKQRLYIVSKGINGDKFKLSEGNMIGANYLPQTFFLPRVDLAIIHGGNNTISECLHYGVPMIVLPCFADQLDNAQRIEDLGLGKRLDPNRCSKEELFDTIIQVLGDDRIAKKCKEVREKMQNFDDVRKVCFVLHKLECEGNLDEELLRESRDLSFEEVKSRFEHRKRQ